MRQEWNTHLHKSGEWLNTAVYFAVFTSMLWTELEKEVQVLDGINICVKLETKLFNPGQCRWHTWNSKIQAHSSSQCVSYSQWNDPFIHREKSLAFGDAKGYATIYAARLQESQRTPHLQFHFITVPAVWRTWKRCCCECPVSYSGPRKHAPFSTAPHPSPSLPQHTMTHLCTSQRAIPNI